MEKVVISRAEEGSSLNYCERCDKYHCRDCVDYKEVDFDIIEQINENYPNPHLLRFDKNWKGKYICPWCYNQLVDKKEQEEIQNEKNRNVIRVA